MTMFSYGDETDQMDHNHNKQIAAIFDKNCWHGSSFDLLLTTPDLLL